LHRRLASDPVEHPGRNNVPELFDSFEVHGPNGIHQCLVMEPLGPSMAPLAESDAANRLPGDVAWAVCRQVVNAIAYVHRVGAVHGGLFDPALLVIRYANTVCDGPASGQHRARG